MKNSVLIIGAGISGLTAGRTLQENGFDVTLIDKGRGVGGRVATRWLGDRNDIQGRWDHGAQFATFRSQQLISKLKSWDSWELMQPWIPSHSDSKLTRMRPKEGMNAFAKSLAKGLNIQKGQRITQISQQNNTWELRAEDGSHYQAQHLISTLPAPQFLDLVRQSQLSLSPSETEQLTSICYVPCLTLLAQLDGPSGINDNGYAHINSGILDTLIDQYQKDISASYTLTAHAKPNFSLDWYDRDRQAAASLLRTAVQEKITSEITDIQIHGWKFAKAIQRIPANFLPLKNGMLLAGDGFAAGDDTASADLAPRIESAMLSGLFAAEHLCALNA